MTSFAKKRVFLATLGLLFAAAGCSTPDSKRADDARPQSALEQTGPTATPGEPEISGAVDETTVRRVARQNRRDLNQCYELGLQDDRALTGQVQIVFSIAPTGGVKVEMLTSPTWENAEVDSCIRKNIEGWVFPAPSDGDPAEVILPFDFSQE